VGAAKAFGGLQQDCLGNAFGIFINFAVPEADDCPAFRLDEAGTGDILGGIDMLAPVDFHDQPGLPVGQIGDVNGLNESWRVNFGR
jgi:hypothetical protein